jgi:hypothetical protein
MALMCDEEMTQCFIPYIDQQPFLHPPEFNFNRVLASYREAAERGGMLLPGANHERSGKVAASHGAVAG